MVSCPHLIHLGCSSVGRLEACVFSLFVYRRWYGCCFNTNCSPTSESQMWDSNKEYFWIIFCFSPRPQWCGVGSSICAIVAPAADLDYAGGSCPCSHPRRTSCGLFCTGVCRQSCSGSAAEEPAQVWKPSAFVRSLNVLKVLGCPQRAPCCFGIRAASGTAIVESCCLWKAMLTNSLCNVYSSTGCTYS